MTAVEFIQRVKARLNRLDTAAYESVRNEEVLLYANDALKKLAYQFSIGRLSAYQDKPSIAVFLSQLEVTVPSQNITNNKFARPDSLKILDLEVFVTIGEETGWMPTRDVTNYKSSNRESNPFTLSFPDEPCYRFIDNEIIFDVNNFTCSKVKYKHLKYPAEILENSTLNYTFMEELEEQTNTLILENLESRRLQSQPAVSKS